MFFLLFLILLLMPVVAHSQTCFSYNNGKTLSCDSNRGRGNTTITELSPGRGIITHEDRNDSSIEPYSIIGNEPRHSAIEPLKELDRLPSVSEQRLRDSGQMPLFLER